MAMACFALWICARLVVSLDNVIFHSTTFPSPFLLDSIQHLQHILFQWFSISTNITGITHAGVWAAMSSFIAHNTEPENRASAQGFLQGMHHGFGKFCGAVFGGMLIKEYGKYKKGFLRCFVNKVIIYIYICFSEYFALAGERKVTLLRFLLLQELS